MLLQGRSIHRCFRDINRCKSRARNFRAPAIKPRHGQRCQAHSRHRTLLISADQTYYQILDVAKDADTRTIKKAFKKMALKYHPDVNKEPNAKEQFMACKTAYQTLTDESDRKKYDRTLELYTFAMTGEESPVERDLSQVNLHEGSGGFDWGNFGQGFGQSSGSQQSQQKRKPKEEEEDFYGFTQFFDDLGRSASSSFANITNLFRDLEQEFQDRQAKKTDQPRSLWQELSDIGEEFVEFLEQGVSPANKAEAKAKAASQQSPKIIAWRMSGVFAFKCFLENSLEALKHFKRSAKEGADSAAKSAKENAEQAARDAKANAEKVQKDADDDIEQMLAELKRKASNKS